MEVRLVFDRYIKESLKAQTKRKRTSGKEIRYNVSDSTKISSISLKSFLTHIDTKQNLTVYLAERSKIAFGEIYKKYVITYNTFSESNLAEILEQMQTHDHEDANTLMILHCWYVAKRDPFTSCTVYSPDTDVFLLLLHFYPSLPQSLAFHTGKGADLRKIDTVSCYEAISPFRAKALLGFHTLTGCDQMGRLSGKSKTFWWKELYKADSDTF